MAETKIWEGGSASCERITREEFYAPVLTAQCAICRATVEDIATGIAEGFVGILGKNICGKCLGLIEEYLRGEELICPVCETRKIHEKNWKEMVD